jgi:hypothetical protein
MLINNEIYEMMCLLKAIDEIMNYKADVLFHPNISLYPYDK